MLPRSITSEGVPISQAQVLEKIIHKNHNNSTDPKANIIAV